VALPPPSELSGHPDSSCKYRACRGVRRVIYQLPLWLWQTAVACPLFFSPSYNNYSSRLPDRFLHKKPRHNGRVCNFSKSSRLSPLPALIGLLRCNVSFAPVRYLPATFPYCYQFTILEWNVGHGFILPPIAKLSPVFH